jgi:sec-independent protein translocase protein TatA
LELIIVIIIILVLFGGWRLPKIGKSIGRTIGYFKKGMSESKEKEIKEKEDSPKKEKTGGKESK